MALPIILSGGAPYHIPFGVRLRGDANSGFYRTVAATTDRRKFTLARWFKLGKLGANFMLWQGYASSVTSTAILINGNGQLQFYQATATSPIAHVVSSAVVLDPTAWYHVVVQVDTTDATPANRVRAWINGASISMGPTGVGYPSLNLDTHFNVSGNGQGFGYDSAGVWSAPSDGVHAEIVFLDGILAPVSQFGFIDAGSGAFRPIKFQSSYGGDNSGHYEFKDASAATAAAIGKDSSGKGNNLTPSNVSVTSGITFDQSLDTPTNNIAILNPLRRAQGGTATITRGNLRATSATGALHMRAVASLPMADVAGQGFYAEFIATAGGFHADGFGVVTANAFVNDANVSGSGPSEWGYHSTGSAGAVYNNNVAAFSGLPVWNNGDVGRIAYKNGSLWLGINNTWFNGGDPAAGTGAVYTGLTGPLFPFAALSWTDVVIDANFGQRAFAYTPPSGFAGITQAPAPTIASGTMTGNANSDGPYIEMGGTPAALTLNGNAVTWGTHARKTATGAKLITASSSYNASGSNSWSATGIVRTQPSRRHFNNAQVT